MTLLPPLRAAIPGVRATQAGPAGARRLSPPLPIPEPRPVRQRPPLRVVPEPASARARRLSRLFTGLSAIVVCFGLFGVIGVHVMLAQGQGDVGHLSEEVDKLEADQQRLALEVAQLESPTRVTAAARQLGMVTPSTVVSLAPASLADPPATTVPAPRATTTTVPSTSTTTSASTSTSAARP